MRSHDISLEQRPLTRPIGVQIHGLRHHLAQDFPGTLAEIVQLGIRVVELVSFPGCRGNPWGDFGSLADWPPEVIGDKLREAGLAYDSAHVYWRQLQPSQFDMTVDWLTRVGVKRAILAELPVNSGASIEDWRIAFDTLNALGMQLQHAGLQFAYHTQANLWEMCDGVRPSDELLHGIDPQRCLLEFDPSGALKYGTNPAEFLRGRPDCFYALHLRDGVRPNQHAFHIPSMPLGAGEIDIPCLLRAAEATACEYYFLEMEVGPGPACMAAIHSSLQYLQRTGWHLAEGA